MLKKCLKHDFLASYKIWIILSAAMLAMSVIGGLSIRVIEVDPYSGLTFLAAIGMFFFYITVVMYLLSGIGLGVYRYYQNFRTDEAYLTFTLPVKRKTLLDSKIISTFLTVIATLTVLFIAAMISMSLIPDGGTNLLYLFLKNIGDSIRESFKQHGGFIIIYVIYALQIAFILLSAIIMLILICFGVANKTTRAADKGKRFTSAKDFLLAMAVYFGISFLMLPAIGLVNLFAVYSDAVNTAGTVTPSENRIILLLTLTIFASAVTIINTFLYKGVLKDIRDKLNLT